VDLRGPTSKGREGRKGRGRKWRNWEGREGKTGEEKGWGRHSMSCLRAPQT